MTILLTVISLTASLEYGVTPDVAFAHGAGRSAEARDVATGGVATRGHDRCADGAVRGRCWRIRWRGCSAVAATCWSIAVTYLRISCVGLPFVLIAYVGHGVMRGVNDLRKPLKIVLVANVVNVVLEIVAVYWLDLGVAGSAWSTVFVQIGAAVVFFRVLRPHRGGGKPSSERMKKLLRSGVHFAVRSIAMFAVWNTSTAVAAHVDTPTLAANQVLTQLFMFLALMLDALGDPGAVAGGRRARRERHRTRPCSSAAPATGCRCGAPSFSAVGARRAEPGPAARVQWRSRGPLAADRRPADPGGHAVPRRDRLRLRRCVDRRARRTLAGSPGGHQPGRVRPVGDRHVVLPAARPRRAVGCAAVVDDDARNRQLATLGVAAMAAGNGIDASNRAVSRTDVALRPLPAAW